VKADRNAQSFVVDKPEDKRPSARYRRRRENNIKTDVKGILTETVDWIDLALDREKWKNVVKKVINLRSPQNTGEFLV
jgi:hypothetical protein